MNTWKSQVTESAAPVCELARNCVEHPTVCAMAVCSAGLRMLVPLLELVELVLQPPLVWMPMARPVAVSMMGLPELPPSVSTRWRIWSPTYPKCAPLSVC